MKRMRQFRYTAVAGALVLWAAASTPARAQADPDDVKRGVARISVIDGDVSVRRGDSGDWVAGVINAPLLAEDRIATGANARAEVQLDSANALRIGANAEVRLGQLEYGRYQVEVAHGTVTYRILRPTTANVEVNTPSISAKPSQQGIYRVSVSEAGETQVTARSGNVEVFTPTGSSWVKSGQTMMARGSGSDSEFQMVASAPIDEWDQWNDSRDRTLLASVSYRYVPEGVYGAEDLDRYGNWVNVPEYGYCWQPVVAAGWSPYGLGRWSWEDWYGWTWVSYDPWGWAPYHYGRWFHHDHYGWAWYPGVMNRHHYWSPALVAFVGWGGGGFGFSMGHIGWIPLAPYETFHPWWGGRYYGRPDYIRNVNIVNVNVTNVYRNARIANGIHGVRGDDFAGGRFRDIGRFNGRDIRDVSVAHGAIPVAPGSTHLNFSDRQARVVPRSDPNTRFFTRQQQSGPAVQRIGFAQQQRGFEQAGMPVRGGQARDIATRDVMRQAGAPAANQGGGQQANPGAGFRRFGDNSRDVTPRANQGATPQTPRQTEAARPADNRGGWQRFGSAGREQTTPAQASPRTEAPAARTNDSRGGWQRFGTPESRPTENRPAAARPAESRPSQPAPSAPERQVTPRNDQGWSRFGNPNAYREQRTAPQTAPRSEPRQQYSAPSPSYSAPRYNAPAPSYSAPRSSAPSYSAPSFSAPRSNPGGGGGGYSAPRSSGGGGGGSSAPRSSGGGGGSSSGSHGGGGGHRGR
jgi:hypothetical protein